MASLFLSVKRRMPLNGTRPKNYEKKEKSYFATASRRLRIANTKNAARRQIPVNTPQTTVNEAPHIRAGIATRKLPIAVATNQPPIIIPLYFGGATFVTNEIPIGESNNSANVSTRYVEINQFGDTSAMCIG